MEDLLENSRYPKVISDIRDGIPLEELATKYDMHIENLRILRRRHGY